MHLVEHLPGHRTAAQQVEKFPGVVPVCEDAEELRDVAVHIVEDALVESRAHDDRAAAAEDIDEEGPAHAVEDRPQLRHQADLAADVAERPELGVEAGGIVVHAHAATP